MKKSEYKFVGQKKILRNYKKKFFVIQPIVANIRLLVLQKK
jgi:hypothetical protein